MALPPTSDVNETFLREVDENLRRDRIRDFVRNNRAVLIGALLVFLAAAGGIIWWQDYRRAQTGKQVEEMASVYRDLAENKNAIADAKLDALEKSSSKAVRASALFTRAAIALDQNDGTKASQYYGRIAADGSMPKPYRDAATMRQVAVDFDKLKPEEVITRLAPYAKPESPWYGTAGEMTAMALIKQGKKQEAGRLFAAIAANRNVPETLRARSVQIAGSLGVDASGALPPAAAQ